MGLYKNVNPVYGKNEKGKRVYTGLNIDGKFYEGIRKTSEIPKQASKPKQATKKQVNNTQQRKKLFGRS